jgi:hypothetical protein
MTGIHNLRAVFSKERESETNTKPILVVTKEGEGRIEREYNARLKPNHIPFSQQELLSAPEEADGVSITPADRLDSGFFQKVSPT